MSMIGNNNPPSRPALPAPDALTTLQCDFPAYHIWQETTLTGPRYIARSRHLNQSPHTLVTRDPAEMRAELSAAKPPPAPAPPRTASTPAVPLPRRRPE
jgi:hypothetical protein